MLVVDRKKDGRPDVGAAILLEWYSEDSEYSESSEKSYRTISLRTMLTFSPVMRTK